MDEPHITIIVPAYNAQKTIKKCIESLIGIDYPEYDILIINDGSTDKTKEILSEYKDKIKIIESQHFGPSKCRNIAVQQANGEFIAFTDSDCLVGKNWLNELLRGFVNNDIISVGGTQLSPQDETEFGKMVQVFFELTGFLGGYIKLRKTRDEGRETTKQDLIKANHNPSCNSMYRKNAFLEIGGFDEVLWPSEDVDLDYRLKKKGHSFMYNPNAIVYHYRPQNLKVLSKMMYRYGKTQGILTKRYGFFRKIQFLPIVFLIFITLCLVNNYILWLVPLFYLILLIRAKNVFLGSHFFALSIFSAIAWIGGFLSGFVKNS